MNGRVAVLDGVLQPLQQATVSVLDRGFLYGDSVFETLRTYGGQPFALRAHLERLERSAERVHIKLPVTLQILEVEILQALAAAGNAESYVRITITRGSGELGLDPALALAALRVVIVLPLSVPPETTYEQGIAAITFATRRSTDGTAAEGAKVGNYLVSVLAIHAAKAAQAGEALVVDAEGRVVEGASSNVFFVREGSLVTAPESAGILPGITRAYVLDLATELGIAVQYAAPPVGDLPGFDEVFLSSTLREILAIVRIDGRPVGGGTPGPLFRRLLGEFRRQVRGK